MGPDANTEVGSLFFRSMENGDPGWPFQGGGFDVNREGAGDQSGSTEIERFSKGGQAMPGEWLYRDKIRAEWGVKAQPGRRGLTLMDINIGSYGAIPEVGSGRHCMAPRGADCDEEMPDLGAILDRKAGVWAENVAELYEEAVQRQWSSATAIPWETLQPLPEEMERAMCVLCTFLSEVEFVAAEVPARWFGKINHDFHEVKCFLATQCMDEARHLEVFRKRALANGGGLIKARRHFEDVLAIILQAETWSKASLLMHLFGEGIVLDLFRGGELLSQNPAEKAIFRLCMQDEARHVAYGTMRLKYHLSKDPDHAEEAHVYLNEAEEIVSGIFIQPDLREALATLLAGDAEKIDEGMEGVRRFWGVMIDNYLKRLKFAGLDRESRLTIPRTAPF